MTAVTPQTKKGCPKAAERQSPQEAREGYRPQRSQLVEDIDNPVGWRCDMDF